jgi:hypothetical protein
LGQRDAFWNWALPSETDSEMFVFLQQLIRWDTCYA